MNTKNREGFNRMIDDCMKGKINMVITKSISRFARNTVDTLNTIRKLKDKNIPVYFETNNINTLEQKGELLITILSSQAQEESRNLSEIVHWGMVRRFENGKVIINHNNFMGYTKNAEGELVIAEEEAKIVRRIFREYIEGIGTTQIKRNLERDGILTKTGKKNWSETVILQMLRNEKYMGDALLQKTYSKDFLTKKRANNDGVLPQYYIENSHPAIIPKEVFYKAKEIRLKRSTKYGVRSKSGTKNGQASGKRSKYILSSLMVCNECGQPFRRLTWSRDGEKRFVYRCASRANHGTKYCKNSPTLEESNIQQTVIKAINRLSSEPAEFNDLLRYNVQMVLDNKTHEENEEELQQLQKEMSVMIKGNTELSGDEFTDRYNELGEKILNLKEKKKEEDIKQSMNVIPSEILDEIKSGVVKEIEFDSVLVNSVIERINVINGSRIEIEYKSGKVVSEYI